jgi:hypothetical protein
MTSITKHPPGSSYAATSRKHALDRLRRQVHDRVKDQVREGEGPLDGGGCEIADSDADAFAARFGAKLRGQRPRQLDPVYRHPSLSKR